MRFPDKTVLLLDFDSTIVTVETLDELARITLEDAPDRDARVAEIEQITAQGMAGEIDFATSLARRFAAIRPTAAHVGRLNQLLAASLSPSFVSNADIIRANADAVWIVSGGFKDFITPLVTDQFGIAADHVYANELVWDYAHENITGYNQENVSAHADGKLRARELMPLPSGARVIIVGDGMTDYAIRAAGLAEMFIVYTETVYRSEVVAKADFQAATFDEVFRFVLA